MLKSRCWFCFLIAIGVFSLLAKIHTFESRYDFSENLLNIQQNFFQAFNPTNYTDEAEEYTTLQLQSLNISSGSGKNSAISEPEITSANTIVTDTATNDKVTTSTDDIVKASTEVTASNDEATKSVIVNNITPNKVSNLPTTTTKEKEDPMLELGQHTVDNERAEIAIKLKNFVFPDGESLQEHTPETGGTPARAIIISTWRSGSTFMGDLLKSHPAAYYHYEPLDHFEIIQVRDGDLAQEAISTIRSLFKCNYTNLQDTSDFIEYGWEHNDLFQQNNRLWRHCNNKDHSHFCWNPEFLHRFCAIFPFQVVKSVRLRLNLTESFMEDDVKRRNKIVLLVRDPRGVLESRKHREWCPGHPDCEDPERLCGDMVDNYYAVNRLIKLYPDRYKVIRYEDFSMDPYKNSEELLQYLGFTMNKDIKIFLDTHTKTNEGEVWSTTRDTKKAPFAWRKKLNASEVHKIQDACRDAMQLWGYRELQQGQVLTQLEPVIDLEHFQLSHA